VVHVVDTHAIIWFLAGTGLGSRARLVMRDHRADLVVPTIVLAEIKYLKAKGRIQPSLSEVMATIEEDPRFTVYPFDEAVVTRMPTNLDIHDAIIVGTALVYRELLGTDARIVTRDPAIASSGVVNTIW